MIKTYWDVPKIMDGKFLMVWSSEDVFGKRGKWLKVGVSKLEIKGRDLWSFNLETRLATF